MLLKTFLNNVEIISIAPSGRSGSYFVQSILDGHKNIVTIPFYVSMYSIYDNISKYMNKHEFYIDAIMRHVCQESLLKYYFGVPYDKNTNWWQGLLVTVDNEKKQIYMDVNQFKLNFKNVLNELYQLGEFNDRGFYYAINLAWALTKHQKISDIKYIVDQTHNCKNFSLIYNISKTAKFIHTIRDPRASYYSFIEMNKSYNNENHHLPPIDLATTYEYTFYSLNQVEKYRKSWLKKENYFLIRLEDLHDSYNRVVLSLAKWLDIDVQKSLFESTMDGMSWEYQSYTHKKKIIGAEKSANRPKWKDNLKRSEIKKIEFLSSRFMAKYKYNKIFLKRKPCIFDILITTFLCLFDKNESVFNLQNIKNEVKIKLKLSCNSNLFYYQLLRKIKIKYVRFMILIIATVCYNFILSLYGKLKLLNYIISAKPYR